jgi:hypothetical protein
MSRPRDTTPEADEVQLRVLRGMTPAQRTTIGDQMSIDARLTALAAIRNRHPEYDQAMARWALFRMLVGDHLFVRAWPDAPLLAP